MASLAILVWGLTLADEAGRPAFSDRQARRLVFLDDALVRVLYDKCGIAEETDLFADWAAGPGGTETPIPVKVIGSIKEAPPLYPTGGQLLVLERDYQYAANLRDGAAPDSFRIATAYFPLDGFDVARSTIEGRGYRVRDDSAAAVEMLRRVSQIAESAPIFVVALNLVGAPYRYRTNFVLHH